MPHLPRLEPLVVQDPRDLTDLLALMANKDLLVPRETRDPEELRDLM